MCVWVNGWSRCHFDYSCVREQRKTENEERVHKRRGAVDWFKWYIRPLIWRQFFIFGKGHLLRGDSGVDDDDSGCLASGEWQSMALNHLSARVFGLYPWHVIFSWVRRLCVRVARPWHWKPLGNAFAWIILFMHTSFLCLFHSIHTQHSRIIELIETMRLGCVEHHKHTRMRIGLPRIRIVRFRIANANAWITVHFVECALLCGTRNSNLNFQRLHSHESNASTATPHEKKYENPMDERKTEKKTQTNMQTDIKINTKQQPVDSPKYIAAEIDAHCTLHTTPQHTRTHRVSV